MLEGMEAFNTRLFEMEGRTVLLEAKRQTASNEVTMLRAHVGQRPPAAATDAATSTLTIVTKVTSNPDHNTGHPTSFGDW